MAKITIYQNYKKVIDETSSNDTIILIVIALIVNFAISRNTKSLSFDRLVFIYDYWQKGKKIDSKTATLSSTWSMPIHFRKFIILAIESKVIKIEKKNEIKINLDEKGKDLIREINEKGLFTELKNSIESITKSISQSDYDKQKLVW